MNVSKLLGQGLNLHRAGQLAQAEAVYRKILKKYPKNFEARTLLGAVCAQHGDSEEAIRQIDVALRINPNIAFVHDNRGSALLNLNKFEEALTSFDRAIALKPDDAQAFQNRGGALRGLERFNEALASFDKAIALRADNAEAFFGRGISLQKLSRQDEALTSFDRAIALKPHYAEAFYHRGIVLHQVKRLEEALESYDQAIALKPDNTDTFSNRGIALLELKRFEEGLASFDKAITLKPAHPHAFSGMAFSALNLCDWTRTAKLIGEIETHIVARKSIVLPFALLGYSSDAALQLKCAQSYVEDKISIPPQPLWNGTVWHHDKIRVAYLSADFHRHATASLTAELFERHDRSRFDVLGISFGVFARARTPNSRLWGCVSD